VCTLSKISFIHLSDIHFVKSSNKPDDIDNDLRKAIITDLKSNATKTLNNVCGILVTGDIAFSGNTEEYNIAKDYLNEICEIFNIKPSDVYCVPGNHDVNQITIDNSAFVPIAQDAVESSCTIDAADKEFSKYINADNQSMLFIPIENYNNFARRFECDISNNKISWQKGFDLTDEFHFRIIGINSSFISTKTDYKTGRLMYIGQSQIPDYSDGTATLLMCHHPPECWKFKGDMLSRINKRADIQLYGHMHSQSFDISENNVILYSGAVHPTRTVDWLPRYNWLSIEGEIENNEKILNIEIFPRCLSSDRDSFTFDSSCGKGKNSIKHKINIDKKRKENLEDSQPCILNEPFTQQAFIDNACIVIDEREIVYNFYDLSWVKQIEILTYLDLISEEDKSKSIATVLTNAINHAKEQGKLEALYKKILDEINLEVK
jgi:calcineurin-like phosphoesterase family protein